MNELSIFEKDGEPIGPPRPVRRGKKGERLNRPSPDKFLDNGNFLLGKFKAKYGAGEMVDHGGVGGSWLGECYMRLRDFKAFGI